MVRKRAIKSWPSGYFTKISNLAVEMRNIFLILLFSGFSTLAQVDSFTYRANHTDDISSVVFSPDGKYVVTGSWDNTVIIQRNDTTAEIMQVVEDFKGAVKTMAFSRDGHSLIIGGQDGRLNFYEFNDSFFQVATKDTAFVLENTQINKLIYGPGMRTIFCAGDNGIFTTFDLVKQKKIPINGTKSITAATVAIDRSSYFIAAKGSPVIRQFDIFGKLINTFQGHGNDITDLLVTLDRKHLISSSKDKTIRVWNIVNAKEETALTEHTRAVTDIDMDPFGVYLVSGSLDGTVNIHSVKEKTLMAQFSLEGYKVNAVALSPDNTKIAVAAQPNGVSNPAGFFEIPTGLAIRKIVLPTKMDLEAVRETNKRRVKKALNNKRKEETSSEPSSKKTGSIPKLKSNAEVLNKTQQVTITIKDNE